MVIEVRLNDLLRRFRRTLSDSGVVTVDMPEGISLGELLAEMEINASEVRIMVVNGVDSSPERVLADGDRVDLFPGDSAAKP